MSKQILDLLNSNGFKTTPAEDVDKCHIFSVGMVDDDDFELKLMYMENEDEDILSFCSPCVYEYNDDDFVETINAMNELSIKNPFVKPVIINGTSVWLYYDHKLFGQMVTLDMIHYMIKSIVSFGVHLLNKIDELKSSSEVEG